MLPVVHPQIVVYVTLSGGRGRVRLRAQIVDAAELLDGPIALVENEVEFPDPVDTIERFLVCTDVPFPTAGGYWVQLMVDGQYLTDRRLSVKQVTGGDSKEAS